MNREATGVAVQRCSTPETRNRRGTGSTPNAELDCTGLGGVGVNNTKDDYNPYLIFINDKPIRISKIKCKDIYKILLNKIKHEMQPFRSRTTPLYNLTDSNWTTLYSIPFIITTNTKLRSFHVRLSHGLLYGNKQLNVFGYKDESNCQLCTTPLQTFQHLMIDCPVINQLWNRIEIEFSNIIDAPLSNLEKELGSLEDEDENTHVKNLLLLIARLYIYHCNLDNITPTYTGLISKLRWYERTEYEIAARRDSVEGHFLKWEEILNSLSIGTQN